MIQSLRDTRSKAHNFTNEYKDTVKESAESQSFLNDFFNIFGIHRRRVATFERPVRTDSRGVKSIDLLWEGVLLVEMKSLGQSLDKAYKQGKNYVKGLNDKQLPRFVLVCDFNEFRLYDLDNNQDNRFELDDLVNNLHLFDFMNGGDVDEITEYDLNEKAALLLGKLHDSLEKSKFTGHQLQVFMVRILFCLFAEDTGVFNRHQFVKYLQNFTLESGLDTEMHLSKLFQILNKPNQDRNTNLGTYILNPITASEQCF